MPSNCAVAAAIWIVADSQAVGHDRYFKSDSPKLAKPLTDRGEKIFTNTHYDGYTLCTLGDF